MSTVKLAGIELTNGEVAKVGRATFAALAPDPYAISDYLAGARLLREPRMVEFLEAVRADERERVIGR